MHLIIAYAASSALDLSAALADLQLPRLHKLLQNLQPLDALDCPQAPYMAHERVLASALGWPESGPWPWAAWQSQGAPADNPGASSPAGLPATEALAWLTPCHWQVGMDQVLMLDPAALALTDDESRALMAAVQPLLQEDGLQLRWHDALHWQARGALLQDLPTASLDRVIGQNLRHWLQARSPGTAGSAARTLARLQSEVQMLLYHHPVNEAREAQRLPTVNAFWLHGAGRLPAPRPSAATLQDPDLHPELHTDLRDSARQGHTVAWQAAWQALDAGAVAELLAQPGSSPVVLSRADGAQVAAARADYEALLNDLETNFADRSARLLTNDASALDVEIQVLRERLQYETPKA